MSQSKTLSPKNQQQFFNTLIGRMTATLMQFLVFNSWPHLMTFMLEGLSRRSS